LPEEQRSIANFSIGPLVDKDTKDTDTDIMGILPKLKHNKATGPDRIATETFIYGTPRFFAHLSIMFSWFLKVGALPAKFTESTIVPLVKVKCGYLSDVENYRAIIVSANSYATYLLRPVYFQLRAGVRYLAVRGAFLLCQGWSR